MAALLFGVTINKKKVVGYMDYICVEQGIYGMQMCVGAGLGALLAVIWPGLPKGWGTMGVFAFQEMPVQQDRHMRTSAFRETCPSVWYLQLSV